MLKIAIVEDDVDLLDEVGFYLRQQGFQVELCSNGKEFEQVLNNDHIDVAIVDIGLPDEDGLTIVRRLRRNFPKCGSIILTARTGTDNRIQGLEEGADVYLSKPVDFRELALIIRSVARRVITTVLPKQHGLILVLLDQLLVLADGRHIELTRLESLLLSRFARASGQQASRQQLVEALGENYRDYDPRRLEAIISRLRSKLIQPGLPIELIRAVRNTGYIFTVPISERDKLE